MNAPAKTGSFLRPVLTLLGGVAGAQVLAYVARPVLTRLYTPEEFGVLTWFTALVIMGNAVSSLRYEDAVMLPRRERDAANVLLLAVGLLVLASLLSLGLVAIRQEFAAAFNAPDAARYVVWLAPALFAVGLKMLADVYLARQRLFGAIAVTTFVLSGITLGVQTATGALGWGVEGLMTGYVAGVGLAAFVAWAMLVRRRGRLLRAAVRPRSMHTVALRYRRFALLTTPAAMVGAGTQRLFLILLPLFFSMEVAGLTGQAFIALSTPLAMVGTSVGQVFYVQAAAARGTPELARLTEKVHRRLVLFGLYPTLACVIAGPALLGTLFGSDWVAAGEFLRVLAPWIFLMSIASPLTRLFDVLEKQRAELLFSLFLFTTQLVALLAGGRTGSLMLTLGLFGAAGLVGRTAQAAWLLRAGGVSWKEFLRPYLRYALHAALPLLLLGLAAAFVSPLLTSIVAILGGIGYYGWTAREENWLSLLPPLRRASDK